MRLRFALTGLLLVLGLIDLSLGRFQFSPPALWDILRQGPSGEMWGLVVDLRLPRVMLAVGSGLALGLSGALCQTLFRNPLAAPEMLGVTAGATLGAVLVILGGAQGLAVTLGAGGGALCAMAALVVLAGAGAGVNRLILTGVGLSLSLGGVSGLLVAQADDRLAGDAILWMTGSLNGSYWGRTGLVWAAVLPLGLAALAGGRSLLRLELGDDLARSLGTCVHRARLWLLALAAGSVAAAVAVVGPVGFVGLMAAPLAHALSRALAFGASGTRRGGDLRGPDLIGAALAGAVIMLTADLMVLGAASYALMPIGVFTGVLGAPLLVALVLRGAKKGEASWG